MNFPKHLLLASGALALLSFASRQEDMPDRQLITRIKTEGFDSSRVMETLFQLTDVSGPRLTGSPGLRRAEDWAAHQLQAWGLVNAGLESWGGFGRGWETQKCYVAMTTPYYQPLIGVPRAWTPGTNGAVRGEAVLVQADQLSDLDKYAGRLKGKIVVLPATGLDSRPNFKPDAARYSEDELAKMTGDPRMEEPGDDGRNNLTQLRAQIAFRRKIDSFLLIEQPAMVMSSRRGTMGTLFTSNGASYAWTAKPALPELEMGYESISRLVRLLQAGQPVSVEADIRNAFLGKDSTAFNVVAEIPGTDRALKDQVVMLGAHIDSWHGATGATDNASGVAVMMEAVRILKALGVQPRRTIRIALWSGEEQGLLGSKGYVKKHFGDQATMQLKPEHAKISAYFNLDNGAGRIRGIYAQGNDAAIPIFQSWLAPFKDLGAGTVTIRNTGSTDHIPFDAIGIPGFQFIQDPLEYGTRTHHTNMDTYDRISKADLQQAAVIVAAFIYNAAQRDELLPRKPLPKARPKV